MTSYYLVSNESPAVDLEHVKERVEAGVRALLGTQDVGVDVRNNGVFWTLTKTVKFIVRIDDSATIASEAGDLAAFAPDDQSAIAAASSRFLCHNHDHLDTSRAEFNYLLSLLSDGHDSWCFRIDDRQFVAFDYDEKALFDKARMPAGLSADAPGNRRKLTRIFAEPLPEAATVTSDEEFVASASDLPPDVRENFARILAGYGYEEAAADEHGRHFTYVKNKRWSLQAHVGRKEIYFSVPRNANVGQSTRFEAYQTCSEIVGDMPVRIYDVKNDEWFASL